MSESRVVYTTPSLRLSTSRNLMIGVWLDAPIVDDVVAIGRASQSLNREFAKGCGMMNLVLCGTPRFSDEVRAAFVRLNADRSAFALGSARVLLLPGLASVAVRAFLNTVRLVSRPARPSQVFGDAREASVWLAPKVTAPGVSWSPQDIQALVARALEAHRAPPLGAAPPPR